MPIGVLINCGSVLMGGLLGAFLGKYVPERVRAALTVTFGVCSMSMGISYIVKVNTLPPVVLSIILGVVAGELLCLEKGISLGVGKIKAPLERVLKTDAQRDKEKFMNEFIAIVILFCASGTGIFGAIESKFAHRAD